MKPLYLVLGGLAVVAVAVVAVLLFTGKGTPPGTDSAGNTITPTTGGFTFTIDGQPQVLLSSPDTNPSKAQKVAKPAAAQAEKIIHDFYVQAFLAPDQWSEGTFDTAFTNFSDGAKAEAMGQLDVMTAGSAAADTFGGIKETDASLKEKVLMDPHGAPYSVVAIVTFTASADMKDGTAGTLTSQGQYILEKTASGWKVTSFSVTRDDRGAEATGSGASTPTAVAS